MLEALLDARWDTSIASRELESEAEYVRTVSRNKD